MQQPMAPHDVNRSKLSKQTVRLVLVNSGETEANSLHILQVGVV